MKIAIVCLSNLASFIKPVAQHLKEEHDVVEIYSNDINEMVYGISDADVVWIEWANEVAINLTNMDVLDGKRIIVRCHSYEFFSGMLPNIEWKRVSNVVFVSDSIKELAEHQVPDIVGKSIVIPNGIDVKEFQFIDRDHGKDIAFVANINAKKGPMLLMHAFNAIVKEDNSFKLHIAGSIQDNRFGIYIGDIVKKLGIENNVIYYGFVNDIKDWLSDKNYLICTSPVESQGMGICEAMAMGIKPLIHNFVGAEYIYSKDFLWNSIDDLIKMLGSKYDSNKYRSYISDNFSIKNTNKRISRLIKSSTPLQSMVDGVTAIIAVKNGEETIGRAIESLLNQTLKPSVIVVDDCSTDNTVGVVSKYDEVKLIKLKENKWVASARNVAAKDVKTKFIMFLDADDYLSEDYVEETVDSLKNNPQCGFAYTDMVQVKDGDELLTFLPEYNQREYLTKNYIPYAAMMRTEEFLPGYSDYLNDCRNHMYDHEAFLRMSITKPAIKSEGGLFYYTIAPDSVSKNYERSRPDMYLQMLSNFNGVDVAGREDVNNILLVCWGRDYTDQSKVSWEAYTFIKPLMKYGTVYTFYWDIEMKYFGKDGMLRRLDDIVAKLKPSCIFHVCYKDFIPVEKWAEISEKYNTVGWFCDDNWRFKDYSKEYSKGFRYVATTYKDAFDGYAEDGLNDATPILSQWAANEHYFKDYGLEKDIDVSFCGQSYGDRMEWLDGLGVERFGKGQPNGIVEFKELARIYNRSKICINFSKGSDGTMQIKCRPFEVTASKSMLLCEYVEGIEDYFEVGTEIICFKTKEELKEKIEYYLSHDEEREIIAEAGYKRTLKDHLWSNRFDVILGIVDGE